MLLACNSVDKEPVDGNASPLADAGADIIASTAMQVTLRGQGSDRDGTVASYRWEQTAGLFVNLSAPTAATTAFTTPDTVQTLTFELTVTDDEGATHVDSINVSVINIDPVANAGADQTVAADATVTLTGSATDSDGSIASYRWRQTAGTTVTLSAADAASTTFVSPVNVELITLELTVTDNAGATHTDSVDITVTNVAPVANAGADKSVSAANTATLIGSGSDADGNAMTYLWLQTAGTAVVLSSANEATTTFTAPASVGTLTFQLTVTDVVGASHVDSITVSVTNTPPQANLGIDQTALSGELVTLANYSTDSDGSIVSYAWSQTAGTAVTLSNASVASPTFVAPAAEGVLTFSLTVTDNIGATATDSVSITVSNNYATATIVNDTPYVRADQATYDTDADCATFEPPYYPLDFRAQMTGPVYQIGDGPVAIVWGGNYAALPANDAALLTQLQTDPVLRQNVVDNLQEMRRLIVESLKIDVSPAVSPVDGKCYRVNFYMSGTGVYAGDTNTARGAGAICDTGGDKEIPYMWLPYGMLTSYSNPGVNQDFTVIHEYIHTLQCSVARGDPAGWSWFIESFASYGGSEISKVTFGLDQFHQNTFSSIDAYFTRYSVWTFWMYLADRFGFEYISDVLQRVSYPDESALEYVYRTIPPDCAPSDDVCRAEAFGNMFAEFANSTLNYALFTNSQGVNYKNAAISQSLGLPRLSAHMHKVATNRYRIADWLAPQRLGYNFIELIPDPNNRTLSVSLEGWGIPARGSEWRATVIATLDDNSVPPVEAYGTMFKSGTQTIDLDAWETSLGASIQRLHLVVVAVPSNWKRDNLLSAFDSPLRYRELDRYVYDLAISGAWPLGHEPDALRAAPSDTGAAHVNGGGFVATTATVDASAYVGPEARVLGTARVTGNARIEGRAIISGSAVVEDDAIVSSSVELLENARVSGYATVRDNVLMRGTTSVSGDGKLQGDASVYSSLSISGQAMSFGIPLTETTGGYSMSGTAMSNGARWLSSGTVSFGSSYDVWTVSDRGLLLAYDFTEPHPYRIKDTHLSSDAYYLGLDGRFASAANIQFDTDLISNVMAFDGTAYLEMPKWALDQRSYRMIMKFKWTGGAQTQYLFDANTARGEQLAVQIIPVVNNTFEVKLLFQDRDGVTRDILLQNAVMKVDRWMVLELEYDDVTAELSLSLNPINSTPITSGTAILTMSTREFDYDTLSIRLGSNQLGTAPFTGSIDSFAIYR